MQAQDGAITFVQGQMESNSWGAHLGFLSLVTSMIVNALVTGLIVFKILKVFLKAKSTVTSVERSLGSTGGTKLRQSMFIIIESGLVLFAIQLIRFVLYVAAVYSPDNLNRILYTLPIGINEMFNVIIRSVHFYLFCFTDNILPD